MERGLAVRFNSTILRRSLCARVSTSSTSMPICPMISTIFAQLSFNRLGFGLVWNSIFGISVRVSIFLRRSAGISGKFISLFCCGCNCSIHSPLQNILVACKMEEDIIYKSAIFERRHALRSAATCDKAAEGLVFVMLGRPDEAFVAPQVR